MYKTQSTHQSKYMLINYATEHNTENWARSLLLIIMHFWCACTNLNTTWKYTL